VFGQLGTTVWLWRAADCPVWPTGGQCGWKSSLHLALERPQRWPLASHSVCHLPACCVGCASAATRRPPARRQLSLGALIERPTFPSALCPLEHSTFPRDSLRPLATRGHSRSLGRKKPPLLIAACTAALRAPLAECALAREQPRAAPHTVCARTAATRDSCSPGLAWAPQFVAHKQPTGAFRLHFFGSTSPPREFITISAWSRPLAPSWPRGPIRAHDRAADGIL